MSTSAVIPALGTSAALPIKNENVTFAVVVKLGEDNKIKAVRHTSSEKDINKLEGIGEDGKTHVPYVGDETIAFKQTVLKPSVGTLDGFAELITDADERLNIVNKGIASKFNQKIRTALIEQDEAGNLVFQPTDGVFDATSLVQEAALRTNMSPADKAMKLLGGLDEATRAAILAQFAAIAAGATQAA